MNVLITGASGGLGRVMANECGRRGYNMFLTDINAEKLACIQRGLERQFNATVTTKACDLTDPKSVDEMLAIIDESGLRFDMLLNIAGIDFEGGFMERERETVANIAALNDVGTLRITHAILDRRTPGGYFAIVFVSSMASNFPMPLKATYAASKRFIRDFATALRQELKPQNANALALCPGGMATIDEVMKAIAAQGLGGTITTVPMEVVARKSIDYALKGKATYIPGMFNRFLAFLGKIVPSNWVAAYIFRRWTHAQAQWLKTERS